MSLEAFKASCILRILAPDLAIDRFKRMQARMPVEHLIKMLDPPSKFVDYAEVLATEAMPAFA